MGPATSLYGASVDVFLCGRRLVHNSYGDGYFWVWSKHAGELKSAENVVCEAIRTWKLELNLEQHVEDVNHDRTPTDEPGFCPYIL